MLSNEYADDLVLIAESEEELREKLLKWKVGMEAKGLKVYVVKTVGGCAKGDVEESGKWHCGVCGKGIGSNSLHCTSCLKWVHKKCSGISGSLQAASLMYVNGVQVKMIQPLLYLQMLAWT